MLSIRLMTAADIPLGMRLNEQAGWNQTRADWLRFLALQPDGCFVAELDGTPVGTTTTCVLGSVAWVAMVLVDPPARRRGIGTALLRHAIEWLDGRGVGSIRLDATPLGRPLYEKLGFVGQYELVRWEGRLSSGAVANVEPARPEMLDCVAALDRRATGTDRGKLLSRLYAEAPEMLRVVCRQGRLVGFLTSRPGTRATFVGPCVAEEDDAARALLADAAHRHTGCFVFLDVPAEHAAALRFADMQALRVQRRFLRMCRGDAVADDLRMLWASSGPEKG